MLPKLFYFKGLRWLIILLVFLAACGRASPTAVTPSAPPSTIAAAPSSVPSAATLPPTPTPTQGPLAARVNNQGITLAEYQSELERFQQATGGELTDADRQKVLDDLINQELLAQAAQAEGFTMDDAALQKRIDALASQLGGQAALQEWMSTNGYTEELFRTQLRRSADAAWMRDQIIGAVPETADQVHVQQILVRTAEEADQIMAKLQAGQAFGALASAADPVTNGELGWFPRGYLFYPELEEAVFKLQPGQYTPVIKTASGYHTLYLIERDPQHPLDPQTHLILQEKALQDWLDEHRQQSTIEIVTP